MDVGRVTGRYLQALAAVALLYMIVGPFINGRFRIDLNIIFYVWAGSSLIKHRPGARTWTLRICAFMLVVLVGILGYALVAGTEHLRVTIGGPIENPSLAQFAGVLAFLTAVALVPFVLLLTDKARREFAPVVPIEKIAEPPASDADTRRAGAGPASDIDGLPSGEGDS